MNLFKTFYEVTSKYLRHWGPVFWDTDRQVASVIMETMQLVLSQFKNFNVVNIIGNFNEVYPYQEELVNVVNWWS